MGLITQGLLLSADGDLRLYQVTFLNNLIFFNYTIFFSELMKSHKNLLLFHR